MRNKIFISILALFFIFANVQGVFAETKNEQEFNKENIINLLEKYNLSYEIVSNNNIEKNINSNISSIKELENIIVERLNEPSVIDMGEQYFELSDSEINLLSSRSIAKLSRNQEISNGLYVTYTVSGDWHTRNNIKHWSNCKSAEVSEYSNAGFTKLGNVNKSVGTVSSDAKKINHTYEYVIKHYIAVPIPGVKDYVHIYSHSQTVTGTNYFYASSI